MRSTTTTILVLVVSLVVLLPGHARGAEGAPLAIGREVDETILSLPLVDPGSEGSEKETILADHWRENGLVVVFAANVCPYVQDWLDRLPRMAALARINGIGFVVLNANERRRAIDDSPEAMVALGEEHAFNFPYLIDRDAALANAMGAQRTPEVFLFDGAKTLVYQGAIDDHSGPFDQVTSHWALDALRQLVAGEEIEISSTAPIGCSVLRPRRRARSSN